MKLWEIAHSRTGDKGNISNISLIAYDPKDYELLKEKVTPERVKEHFKGIVKGDVVRYELPNICGVDFGLFSLHGCNNIQSKFMKSLRSNRLSHLFM